VTDLSRVVVLGGERAEFGVLADAAHEVVTLRTEEVLEPPGSVAGIGREYLRGVTRMPSSCSTGRCCSGTTGFHRPEQGISWLRRRDLEL